MTITPSVGGPDHFLLLCEVVQVIGTERSALPNTPLVRETWEALVTLEFGKAWRCGEPSLATGLANKEQATVLRCSKCNMTWLADA